MNFRVRMCEHLARYRKEVLGIEAAGFFRYRNGERKLVQHILPVAERDKNILERYRAAFWASDHRNISFHQFFHHLNSSQALCINLFYPLIAEGRLGLFSEFLGLEPEAPLAGTFEKSSDIEDAVRKTSVDFHVCNARQNQVFVEVKYTAHGFGRAKADREHFEKFETTYRPLVEASPYLVKDCRNAAFFLNHYQILRDLVHIGDTARVVLLFPEANAVVAREAQHATEHLLTPAGRERTHVVHLEPLVGFLASRAGDSSLATYMGVFHAKYLGT